MAKCEAFMGLAVKGLMQHGDFLRKFSSLIQSPFLGTRAPLQVWACHQGLQFLTQILTTKTSAVVVEIEFELFTVFSQRDSFVLVSLQITFL